MTETYQDLQASRVSSGWKLQVLLGKAGFLPKIGKVVELKTGPNEALLAKITVHPHSRDDPVEAKDVARQRAVSFEPEWS
jgi:hypothetical protein